VLLRLDDDELRPIVDKGLLGPARQASDVALRVVALHVLAHHDDEGVEHFGLVLSELGASAPYDVHHTIQGLGGSLDGLVVALVAVLELRHAGHKRKLMRACEVVVARVVVARVVVAREMVAWVVVARVRVVGEGEAGERRARVVGCGTVGWLRGGRLCEGWLVACERWVCAMGV